MERATVQVNGVVQSVGFRPFVYRTAADLDLRGTVRNLGDAGVRIELEGAAGDVDAFLTALREENPPLARVETVEVDREPVDAPSFEAFEIVESAGGDGGGGTIPPDTAMCDACVGDMRDADSRYHDYWATACVDCGPRFTVIEALPYDRPSTSMDAFPMCEDCRAEYQEPTDRRYHAQTIACPQCGPTLRYGVVESSAVADAVERAAGDSAERAVEDGTERQDGRDPFPAVLSEEVDGRDAVRTAAAAVDDGDIVVVKGIGGAHLVCDATDDGAVQRLRERTGRPQKPFALMAPDVDQAESFARVTDAEREALASPDRPILLLEERDGNRLSGSVAPGLHTVGVMLPYSGAHHLLFDDVDGPLVMTSANMPGQPMLVENGAIVAGLLGDAAEETSASGRNSPSAGNAADGVLVHDRRIVARCDDSVARFVDGRRRLVRRSRGFVPTPVPTGVPPSAPTGPSSSVPIEAPSSGPSESPGADAAVLGLGPERDVAAAVLDGGDCYLTQYVGDVDDVATFEYLTEAVDHLRSITGLDQPPVVAHDAHPEFRTTEHARRLERERGVERVPVQHHHAHAASVLAERGREAAIAVTVDGVGYGPDGTVWGGEVLDATRTDYERVAGLAPMAMPGGDRATRYPGRMLAGALFARDENPAAVDAVLARHGVALPGDDEERDIVVQQLDAGVNTPETTSAGRFLDAVSALLGVCDERTYEGEPAMKLEALAARGTARRVDLPFGSADGRRVLDAPELLARLVELVEDGVPDADVAATAQDALGRGLSELAVRAAAEAGRDAVALSGGVAYNEAIAARVRRQAEDAGLAFLGNERVPPGDGGIAYGQVTVAAARRDERGE